MPVRVGAGAVIGRAGGVSPPAVPGRRVEGDYAGACPTRKTEKTEPHLQKYEMPSIILAKRGRRIPLWPHSLGPASPHRQYCRETPRILSDVISRSDHGRSASPARGSGSAPGRLDHEGRQRGVGVHGRAATDGAALADRLSVPPTRGAGQGLRGAERPPGSDLRRWRGLDLEQHPSTWSLVRPTAQDADGHVDLGQTRDRRGRRLHRELSMPSADVRDLGLGLGDNARPQPKVVFNDRWYYTTVA